MRRGPSLRRVTVEAADERGFNLEHVEEIHDVAREEHGARDRRLHLYSLAAALVTMPSSRIGFVMH